MEHEAGQAELWTKTKALCNGALKCVQVAALAAALMLLGAIVKAPQEAAAIGGTDCVAIHCTDGTFTTAAEWDTNLPAVSKTFFPVVGTAGGSYLYVDQTRGQQRNLYLMYDYVNSPNTAHGNVNSFFDVFFEVPSLGEDYLVRIMGTNIMAFEKPSGTPSLINPDGSFDTGTPWKMLEDDDLLLARFQGAVRVGTSPDSSAPHLLAEFQLSINTNGAGNPNGLYSPERAFWSASDDPLSSAYFTLNADGTTTVEKALGPDGAPVRQPQDVGPAAVPEPSTLLLMGTGLLGFLASVWRRKRRS